MKASQSLSYLCVAAAVLAGCGNDAHGAIPPECAGKNTIKAEGSTTQTAAMTVFADAWAEKCPGKKLEYVPTGSADGRVKFIGMESDLAGSDSPLADEQIGQAAQRCGGNPVMNLPLVFTAVAMVFNVPGLPDVVVNGRALAGMFTGAITNWNDPALALLNPGVVLPDLPVVPVFRGDSAGITNDFQKYLSESAGRAWPVGTSADFLGGVGVGAEKSGGVIGVVQATPGAIGYVEASLARRAGLPMAHLDSGQGVVALNDESAMTAIDATEFVHSSDDLALNMGSLYRTREPGGYPLLQVTYEIVCAKGNQPDTAAALKSLLNSALDKGQLGLPAAGYIPVPKELKYRMHEAIETLE